MSLEEVLFGESELSDHDSDYVAYLTSCPLDKLIKEPESLQLELERVQGEMKSTVVSDYQSFIQASQCINQLNSSMDNLANSLKNLSSFLTPLPTSCENFSRESVPLKKDRDKNKLVLDKYDKMLDLLKIPQLMEKRVKQGSYEEALQLQQFAKQLLKKHRGIPIIESIAQDVEKQGTKMREQLHINLRQNIKMHQCSDNISFLRRLEVYNNTELRVIFLKSRNFWFHSQKARLSTKNAYSYLSKLIDLTRDYLKEVITQYRIIFSTATDSTSEGGGKNDSAILSSWIVHQIQYFINELEKYLVRINEGSSIRNLMDHAISISRVGVDVSGFLPKIFEEHVLRMFSNFLTTGVNAFSDSISSDSIVSAAKAHNPLLIERRESFAPNRILLELPPLATLTNSFLHAFNELRQCAIITIRPQLAKALSESLEVIVQKIKSQKSSSRSSRQADFARLVEVCAEHFLPYMEKVFSHIFGVREESLINTQALVEQLLE